MTRDTKHRDKVEDAARQAARRERIKTDEPEPSLGSRLGQIGVLGWAILAPILLGVVIGRIADRYFHTGIELTAAAIFVGAAIGMHAAWKWMVGK